MNNQSVVAVDNIYRCCTKTFLTVVAVIFGVVLERLLVFAETCNCPEEFDVWEMGGQNWHITGDERNNSYTNTSVYCNACKGPFEASASMRQLQSDMPSDMINKDHLSATEAAGCPGGYVVTDAGTAELNGCYAPTAELNHGTPVYHLTPSPSGLYANASLFLYPQTATDNNTKNWLWRIGTLGKFTPNLPLVIA